MSNLTEHQRQHIIELLDRGEDLPQNYKHLLFPPERQEYELVYAGKEREEDILAETMAVPLQPVRTFGDNDGDDWQNMLIFGDNLQAMKTLLRMKDEGKLVNADGSLGVKLIYIDPPFATKQDFQGKNGELAYQDKIAGAEFFELLRKRIVFLRELLTSDGSLYIHLDSRQSHYIKAIMDEIFPSMDFAEIVWVCGLMGSGKFYPKAHETIFCYKSRDGLFNPPPRLGYSTRITSALQKDADGWFYTRGRESSGGSSFLKTYICDDPTLSKEEAIAIANAARPQPAWDVWIGKRKLAEAFNDHPVGTYAYTKAEKVGYPTQKPEALLKRIIIASSNSNDIVLDAFAGSGTTLAVAEKLDRRWIGIDSSKLAIYTIQKRMLNLQEKIGNKGKRLEAKPFTLYNAGLYDFAKLKRLPWKDWRFFALHLFQCRDEPHTVGGVELDGYRRADDVLVFNHLLGGGAVLDYGFIDDLHNQIGGKVGSRLFVIAPAASVVFLEDYIDKGRTRYYILRIPYSIINELHTRPFESITQPVDESQVNETVEAVGFDFIRLPEVKCEYLVKPLKGELIDEAVIQIKIFKSKAMVKGATQKDNRETLSMVMVDYDYPLKEPDEQEPPPFEPDQVFYASNIEQNDWEVRMPLQSLGEQAMIIYIDIYGNEYKEVKTPADFQAGGTNA
jgi:site-specific DNA-methyltransferase (adenine-specific)/adenine-specific DNA-methyltransferase